MFLSMVADKIDKLAKIKESIIDVSFLVGLNICYEETASNKEYSKWIECYLNWSQNLDKKQSQKVQRC